MREFHGEDNNAIAEYNNELWATFFNYADKVVSLMPGSHRTDISQAVDVLRAINSYRTFGSVQEFVRHYPELSDQTEYVELLWNHFSTLGDEFLADLAIQMIHELGL